MKLSEGKATDYLQFPIEETRAVITAMKRAEEAEDIQALRWCARRLAWIEGGAEVTESDDYNYPAHLFNKARGEMLKSDPPPDSIKSIIAEIGREEDGPGADSAEVA